MNNRLLLGAAIVMSNAVGLKKEDIIEFWSWEFVSTS